MLGPYIIYKMFTLGGVVVSGSFSTPANAVLSELNPNYEHGGTNYNEHAVRALQEINRESLRLIR